MLAFQYVIDITTIYEIFYFIFLIPSLEHPVCVLHITSPTGTALGVWGYVVSLILKTTLKGRVLSDPQNR